MNLAISRGDRILLLGANGSGKSTLLAGLAGKIEAVAGSREKGERWLQMLHWEQAARDACDPEDETPLEFVTRLSGGSTDVSTVLAMLDGVGVDRFAARRPCGCLSSGERTLTALSALCVAPKHILLLDEPTAFLGATAVQAFAEALSPERWPGGTLVFTASNRAAAEMLRPTHTAMISGGHVVLHERPPCDADWAALSLQVEQSLIPQPDAGIDEADAGNDETVAGNGTAGSNSKRLHHADDEVLEAEVEADEAAAKRP